VGNKEAIELARAQDFTVISPTMAIIAANCTMLPSSSSELT
tara:strand:+ start:667 stop:789 length:123 start_codon:yes stop_codon:yes gene_type:complete